MKRINIRLLPKDFRYFLSKREIKEIEKESAIIFRSISDASTTREHFKNDREIQSSIRAFTIKGKKNAEWEFDLRINGFRSELLPKSFENDIKEEIKLKTIDYLRRVINSKETDGLINPEMWTHIMIIDNKVKIGIHENK